MSKKKDTSDGINIRGESGYKQTDTLTDKHTDKHTDKFTLTHAYRQRKDRHCEMMTYKGSYQITILELTVR